MIQINPLDCVDAPKNNNFVGSYYSPEEVKQLMEIVKGTHLELPVILGFFCGMRRSEIIGLKWSAVDFEHNTFSIRHTVTTATVNHKRELIFKDRTKNKSSRRSLPLEPLVREKMLELKEKQERYKKLCKSSYNKEYVDYVFVNEIGDIITPDYVSRHFNDILEKTGMRHIRFHDLRHTAASMLLANGVSMKEIQEWLGHSDFSTTANIYSHLDYNSKLVSANTMLEHTIIE